MPEGRVTHVMAQGNRLRERFVQAERRGEGARDLGDLKRVRQARQEVVAVGVYEDLRLVFEPPERFRVQDPIAVSFERRPELVGWLWPLPSATVLRSCRGRGEPLFLRFAHEAISPDEAVSHPTAPR